MPIPIPNDFPRLISPHAEMSVAHEPVLYHEIIHALRPKSGGFYVDGTVGTGGHAAGILEACRPDGQLLGLDLDPQALEIARKRLIHYANRAHLVQATYTTVQHQLRTKHWPAVDGILLDLGASSLQLERPERGFSFQANGPLDMRFDPTSSITAGDLVNGLTEDELSETIYRYGEEPAARRIAKAILHARPLTSTQQLAEVIAKVKGGRRSRTHPATQTFQALRIAVNDELKSIETALAQMVPALKPRGRLAIIAFHSLEDRIVKNYFRVESRDCICPPRQPVCTCGHTASIREVTRHPIRPSVEEIKQNPRSRSARLRVAEKI